MKLKKVWAVYFSGTGTTRRTVERIAGDIAARLGLPVQSVDFSRPALRQETLRFSDTDLVVFGTPVYAGMVVGICSRNEDMTVNVCKRKQLTNMRAAGSDEATRLTPPKIMSLEQCLEFLADDELLECTPKSLRIRKRELDHATRMRELMKKRNQ